MASGINRDPDDAFVASDDSCSGNFELLGTPNARLDSDSWGIALPGPTAKGCLLVNERLGAGAFSQAQLVKNRDNEVRPRKLLPPRYLPNQAIECGAPC